MDFKKLVKWTLKNQNYPQKTKNIVQKISLKKCQDSRVCDWDNIF